MTDWFLFLWLVIRVVELISRERVVQVQKSVPFIEWSSDGDFVNAASILIAAGPPNIRFGSPPDGAIEEGQPA